MSLDREYSASKVGATRKKAVTTSATSSIELITPPSSGVFSKASFAIRVSEDMYVRQNGSATAPTDMTLEFELLTTFIWRVDVEDSTERYLHLRAIDTNGTAKITDITKVSGTTSDLDA